MNKYLGETNIWKNSFTSNSTNYSLPGNIILNSNWINHSAPSHWLTHELGHTWDIRSSDNPFVIGGVGDALNDYIGGGISSTSNCRFCNKGYPINADPHIPVGTQFPITANLGYGNGATSDYLAEAFAFSVYGDSVNLPTGVGEWVGNEIINQTLLIVMPSQWYGVGTR